MCYGYRDVHEDDLEFENDLVCNIAEFIKTEKVALTDENVDSTKQSDEMVVVGLPSTHRGVQFCEDEDEGEDRESAGTSELREIQSPPTMNVRKRVQFVIPESPQWERRTDELRDLAEAREGGVAYIWGTRM